MRRFILLFALCNLAFGQSSNYPQVSVTPTYGTDSGSSSAYVVKSQSCPASLYVGLIVSWLPANANSVVNPTMNYCRFGAKVITKLGGNVLVANDLIPTAVALTLYDGATWQLQNPASTSVISRAVAAPSSINFGTVQSGSSSQAQSITISNTGSMQAITVVSAAFTGSTDFKSVNVSVCNGPLAAQATCVIPVFFNPSSVGAKTAALLINTDVSPQISIALSGTGGSATTYPITVTGTDTGFGVVTSVDGNFNCTMAPPALPSGSCSINYASGANVTFTATASVGSTFQNFNGCGLSVSPGSFTVVSPGCTVAADFSSNAPVNVPSLAVAPGAINFGTIQTGTPSPSQSVTLSNASPILPLTINSVVLTGDASFTSSNPNICNGVLSVGASCVVSITFTPSSGTAKIGSVTVNSNAAASALTTANVCGIVGFSNLVNLCGSGTPTPTFPLSVNCAPGTGNGTIISGETPPLINAICATGSISGVTSNNYVSGSVAILTATSTDGGSAGNLSGGSCASNPCSVTVTAGTTVTGSFTAPVPNVNLNIVGGGAGNVSVVSDVGDANGLIGCQSVAGFITSTGGTGCSGAFPQGTTITLTATVLAGSTFSGYIGIPGCTPTPVILTCQFVLNSNTTVTISAALTAAQITLVQSVDNCATTSTTIKCTLGSAVNASDTIIVGGGWPDATTTVVSVADTANGPYTQVPTVSPKVGTALTQAIYYFQNSAAAAAGTDVITMTLSTSVTPAILGSNLTSGQCTSACGTTFTTASVTPTTGRLQLLAVDATLPSGNGPGPISTVTGDGLTWVFVTALNYAVTEGTATSNRVEVWRAMGTASTGALTITFGTSPSRVAWTLSQFSGTDTTGTNGSGAIGIVSSNGTANLTASPLTVTMGAFGSASNGTYGVASPSGDLTTQTAGPGMTLLGVQSNLFSIVDEWAAGNISPVQLAYVSGSGSLRWGIIGIELKVPSLVLRRDMRVLDYAGLLASGSPIDVSAAAVGTSSTPAAGSITTTVGNDLLTGFTFSNQQVQTSDVAHGWTQRVRNTFGDDAEDQQGVVSGTVANFQPLLNASGNWVATNIAWKAANGSIPTSFTLTLSGDAGNGNGTVTSNAGSPNLNCSINAGVTGPNCSSVLSPNSTVIMTASPALGSSFGGWNGVAGCGAAAQCTISNVTSNYQNVTALFSLSGGQNFYASASGSGTACTQASPCTLQQSINSFTLGPSGATIHASAGNYTSTVSCGGVTTNLCVSRSGTSNTQRLVIQCDPGVGSPFTAKGKCNLIAGGSGEKIIVMDQNGFNSIVGFDMTGPAADAAVWFGRNGDTNGKSFYLIGNYIHDIASTQPCELFGGLDSNAPTVQEEIKVLSNVFTDYNRPWTRAQCNTSHMMYLQGPGLTIENNLIGDAPKSGVTTHNGTCGAVISNNVFLGNGRTERGILPDNDTGTCTAGSMTTDNNYFAGQTGGIIGEGTVCTSSTPNFYGNNFSDGTQADFAAPKASCDTVSPSSFTHALPTSFFVNYVANLAAGTGDYHLKAGSSGINAGTTICTTGTGALNPCVPNTDITGTIRPQGPAPDVGVYEQ